MRSRDTEEQQKQISIPGGVFRTTRKTSSVLAHTENLNPTIISSKALENVAHISMHLTVRH